jgi:hypothetical protein
VRALVLAAALALGGCPSAPLVSPYDEAIDKGIVEFYEQLNLFIRDVSELAGRPEGTYEANTRQYNRLETKVDVLILRASSASQGAGCRLEARVYEKVAKLLDQDMPAEMKAGAQPEKGDANGCNARLLELVKQQVRIIRDIHKNADKCDAPSGKEVSCLRPATAASALKIANQSINAVSVVEAAKRN